MKTMEDRLDTLISQLERAIELNTRFRQEYEPLLKSQSQEDKWHYKGPPKKGIAEHKKPAMKITKLELIKIIKEEINKVLN